MERTTLQKIEWAKAQRIEISEDLVAAAKNQLKFLEEVDKMNLYEGPILKRAINRYQYCWLPLLAKNEAKAAIPLVVPIDCEWIWHCHRLNPVCYKADCEKNYGKILDSKNVKSSTSVDVNADEKKQSEDIWKKMYPNEPYELSPMSCTEECQYSNDDVAPPHARALQTTKYDLLSAVRRQSSFYYQVSRAHMKNDRFLQAALARYKGFLHINKRSRERSIDRQFWVPTYDIDLMWHSHQLLPACYAKDILQLLGTMLGHDDSENDRTKGMKLDIGFTETTKRWEEAFGSRYWRAGAMYRGSAPTSPPVPRSSTHNYHMVKLMEVMVEIVAVKDLPAAAGQDGVVFVSCSKQQLPNNTLTKRKINILPSDRKEKDIAVFQCEPTGELVFELMSSSMILETASISLQDLLSTTSELSIEKWFQLVPTNNYNSNNSFGVLQQLVGSKPTTSICIAISFTPPEPVPISLVQRDIDCAPANCTGCGGGCRDVDDNTTASAAANCGSCVGCGGSCHVDN